MSRILLAEDSEANRELVREALEARGYEVILACDGQEALDMILETKPDLVLMDIQMPHLDGFAALRLLREQPQCAQLPVLALTAYAMEGDQNKAVEAGFDGYLTKPIDLKMLAAEVQRWLARQSPGVGTE